MHSLLCCGCRDPTAMFQMAVGREVRVFNFVRERPLIPICESSSLQPRTEKFLTRSLSAYLFPSKNSSHS
jgi:hypothetical protein